MEVIIDRKTCSLCKENLELKYFNKHTAHKDGYEYHCRKCEYERRELLRRRKALYIEEDCVLPKIAFRICTCCKESKPIEEYGRTKKTKLGYHAMCKLCTNKKHLARKYKDDPQSILHRQRQAEYRKRNPEPYRIAVRVSSLKRTGVNITVDEYKEKSKLNKGYCDICGNPNKSDKVMALDHCHTTGQVRGWLCDSCNGGLGMFKDNVVTMLNAILYLKQYKLR